MASRMPGELKEEGDEIPVIPLTSWKGHEPRVTKIVTAFTQTFQHKPAFFARVPGRVNLIGEHVDYCGYAVFPMAIDQDVLIAASAVPTKIPPSLTLCNTAEEYPSFQCLLKDVSEHLKSRELGVSPPWHLFFLCGVLGILEELGIEAEGGVSMEIYVDGKVPPRAGLSSSSALVCAAALTTLVCNQGVDNLGVSRKEMDQAIAFLASAGTAQKIDFVPVLKGEKAVLPSSAVFVIAHSLVEANKAASDGYNVRVAECRLATWILAKQSGLDFLPFEKVKQLQLALGKDFNQMLSLVEKWIHKEPYNAKEVAEVLGLSSQHLAHLPLMNRIPLESISLKLYHRISHVLREAGRVEDFHAICSRGSGDGELAALGNLMNESHKSLVSFYECSHPALDKLVAISQTKAHGARLTGAGWGGCMVALCEEAQLGAFLEALKREYYNGEDAHVFITQPGAGATILV